MHLLLVAFLPFNTITSVRYNNYLLPSPRIVSVSVLMSAGSRPPQKDPLFTHMVMQWGQFLDHDLDFTTMAPSIQRFSDGLACRETCDRGAPCFPITGKSQPTFECKHYARFTIYTWLKLVDQSFW